MTSPHTRDSKSDLLDAARAAVKDREDKAVEAALASRHVPRRRRIGALMVIGLAGIALLIIQPVWLVGPKAPPPETEPVLEASLRLSLLRQRSQIFEFSRARGRLPADLTEAGDSVPGVRYERIGADAFRLIATVGDSLIVLQSSDSGSFIGQSIAILRNRGQE
jgi:hypothetical protein